MCYLNDDVKVISEIETWRYADIPVVGIQSENQIDIETSLIVREINVLHERYLYNGHTMYFTGISNTYILHLSESQIPMVHPL